MELLWKHRWPLLTMVAVVAVVYAHSLGNGFVNWDDNILVYRSPIVRNPSWASVWKAFSSYDPELYIPLTFLMYIGEFALVGMNAFVFHFNSLALHLGTCVLIYAAVTQLTQKKEIALWTALLFGIHPLNAEAVSWISARKDLLSSLLALGALVLYLRGLRWRSVITFVLALLAKVSVVVLPVVLLLVDWWRGEKISKQSILAKWPYWIASLVFGLVALGGKSENFESITPMQTGLLSVKSSLFLFGKSLVPLHLSAFYEQRAEVTLSSPEFLIAVILFFVVCGAVWVLRRRRELVFGAVWFILFVAPSYATFSKQGMLFYTSDRYAYLALIGVLFAVVSLLTTWLPRRAYVTVFSICALCFAGLTYQQSLTWYDTTSMYEQAVRAQPDALVPQTNLGSIYFDNGELEKAKARTRDALDIDPNNYRANANMGALLGREGRYEEAIPYLLKSLEYDPEKAEEYEQMQKLVEQYEAQ